MSIPGGTVAPGISPEILNTGNVTFWIGSTFATEFAGTTVGTGYDQLNVTGTVTLGSATLTTTALSFSPSVGNTFTIINNDNTDAVSGTFAGLPEGATITNFLGSGLNATITYVGGAGGNDVVITVSTPALPVLNVTTDPTVTEGDAGTTLATFTVTLTPASASSVTVDYSTQDNSATAGDSDYVAIPDTLLTFDPGQTTKNIRCDG